MICDNDNVTPDGKKNSGNIGGKPGYMAPEIVRGESHPNSLTDCHSLAVILFKLFCRHDPLMGEQYVKSVCITEKREFELYGLSPVFIFDPNNATNRPVQGVHPNPIKLWPVYPAFLQEAFIKSFSEGMKNPNARLMGTKIGAVNTAIREVLPELMGIGGSDVHLKIACLKFSSGYRWMHPSPVSVDNFQWNNLDADGVTDFGAACRELSDKMSKDKFLSAPSASVAPAIFRLFRLYSRRGKV